MKVLSANLFILVIGLIISFIIPSTLSTENYGYLQLFTLYLTYNGFFILGFNDGIHLNYAGLNYDEDLFIKFRAFAKVVILISLIGILIVVFLTLIYSNGEKQFIFILTGISIIVVGLNGFTAYTNQNTFRFTKYSQSIIIEKIVYLVFVLALVFSKSDNYRYFVFSIFIASITKLIYNLITSHDIFFGKSLRIIDLKNEIIYNFRSGFTVMIALILYSSISTGGRLLIEKYMGIDNFGVFSFALNTLVIASIFFTAISQVFYPILAKMKNEISRLQDNIDEILLVVSIILLFSYFPVYYLVYTYYHKYADLLNYLAILYPLFIFKGKYLILIMNGLKVNKKLGKLIQNSIIGILMNAILTGIGIFVFNSMIFVAIGFLISHIVWYYHGLFYYNKVMNIKYSHNQYLDLLVILGFILTTVIPLNISTSITAHIALGVVFQFILFATYMFIKKRKIIDSIRIIKNLRGADAVDI